VSLLKSSREVSRTAFNRWADFYDSSWIINKITGGWDNYLTGLSLPEPILDLGCATGRLLRKLFEKGYSELSGLDISEHCLSIARNNTDNNVVNLTQGCMEQMPYINESFSTVILSGVLHHLEDPAQVLREINRVLKSPGIFIVCEPYFFRGLRHILNLALDIYPVQGDRRYYTWQQVAGLAEKVGFHKKDLLKAAFSFILIFEKC
jgi:ubiquinone/menaquinone biosynthesis C-methylase UbiE